MAQWVQIRSMHLSYMAGTPPGPASRSLGRTSTKEAVAGFNPGAIKEHQRSWPYGLQGRAVGRVMCGICSVLCVMKI